MNNWDTRADTISFLDNVLDTHTAVKSWDRQKEIVYHVQRKRGLKVVAVVVGRYMISLADVVAAKAEFPEMTCIVAHGTWCGYTDDAVDHGKRIGVGVFKMNEFIGALNRTNANDY